METEESISLQQNKGNDIKINDNTDGNRQFSDQQDEHQHATINHNTIEEDDIKGMPKDDPIKEKLDVLFKKLLKFRNKKVEQRTKVIDKDIIKGANEITGNHLCSLETVWFLALLFHVKEIINDLPTGEIKIGIIS